MPKGYAELEFLMDLPSGQVDITDSVMDREIRITVGKSGETTEDAPPSSCTFTVYNPTRDFSPRFSGGQWFREFTVGVPIYVLANKNTPADPVRFAGKISSIRQAWDKTGQVRTAVITAHGVTKDLLHGRRESPLRRQILRPGNAGYPFEYWACEADENVSALGSLVGGEPLSLEAGTYSSSSTYVPGSDQLLSFTNGARLVGKIRPYTPVSSRHSVSFIYTGLTSFRINGSGSIAFWTFDGTNLRAWDRTNSVVNTTNIATGGTGGTRLFSVVFTQSGSNISVWHTDTSHLMRYSTVAAVAPSSYTINSHTIGNLTSIELLTSADAIAGHFAVGSNVTSNDMYDVAIVGAPVGNGYNAGVPGDFDPTYERAHDRINRIATDAGVNIRIPTDPVISSALGTYLDSPSSNNAIGVMREAATGDGGILCDDFRDLGLAFFSRMYLSSVTPGSAWELDLTAGEFAKPPDFIEDDQRLSSEYTVKRTRGSAARYAPDGDAEERAPSVTMNLMLDGQAMPAAEWRSATTQPDEPRMPYVELDLLFRPGLIDDWHEQDVGSRLRLLNLPLEMGAGFEGSLSNVGSDYMLTGWTEIFTFHRWCVRPNLVPVGPFRQGRLGATYSARLDEVVFATSGPYDENDTVITVTTGSVGPQLPDDLSGVHVYVVETGEELEVTDSDSVNGTITVTRSVNGVEAGIEDDYQIRLVEPFLMART